MDTSRTIAKLCREVWSVGKLEKLSGQDIGLEDWLTEFAAGRRSEKCLPPAKSTDAETGKGATASTGQTGKDFELERTVRLADWIDRHSQKFTKSAYTKPTVNKKGLGR